MASGQMQNRPHVACSLCMGTGQDAFAPHRETADRSVVYIVRACPACDGRGVVATPDHPSEGGESSFGLSTSLSLSSPVVQDTWQRTGAEFARNFATVVG